MKLEDAVRKSLTIDGVECSSVREFISKLEKAKNLSMVVYVNTKLVCSGPALLRSDNNWIIASADCQISFKESVSVDSIRVYIKQGSTELFESVTTNCNTIIPANDTLATFYVCLGNDAPYNELAKRVPESRFTPISVNRIPDTSFDDITSTLNDGADVIIDDGGDGGYDHQPDVLATSGTLSVQIIGSTNLVAQPLFLDDETFSPGFELQITQNVSHTLMIPLVDVSAEISISDMDGLCLDGDIQYVDPLPDDQQRPDIVKNALVTFTISVDYVLLNVNAWVAETP